MSDTSAATLYFHNALGRIELVPDAYVRITWQAGVMDSAQVRAVYEHALHLLKRTGLTKILTDHRRMGPFLTADREWLTRTWAPRAVEEAGYRHSAVVQAEDRINRLGTQHIAQTLGNGLLTVEHFDSPEAADAWLRAQ